jgi:hypothetical protein
MNTADPQQIKKAKKAADKERLAFRNDLAHVLATYQGRHIIMRILLAGSINRTVFAGERTHEMAMLEGRRMMAQEMLEQVLTLDPQIYIVMRNEHSARELELKGATT